MTWSSRDSCLFHWQLVVPKITDEVDIKKMTDLSDVQEMLGAKDFLFPLSEFIVLFLRLLQISQQ